MRKLLIVIVLTMVVFLNACNINNKEEGVNYDISDNSIIEIVYYEKFSENQKNSHYDILKLALRGDQITNYSFINEVLNKASKVSYDSDSIILGIPIGAYQIKISNNDTFGVMIRFRQTNTNIYEFEIYKTENDIAFEKYQYQLEDHQEIVSFINYVQEKGVLEHIS